MKQVGRIKHNALKILEYLVDANAIAGGDIKAQDVFNRVGLEKKDFDAADMFLLQQQYVEGTLGGMAGSRWLTGSGIDYYEENASLIDHEPSSQRDKHMPDPKKVFVVHGRDNRLRSDFFSFLRALSLNPIEWSDAIGLTGLAAPYIGQVLDSAFSKAQAVIVLLTPDDEVRLSPDLWKDNEDEGEKAMALQARPNVLFEAGMAFGTHPDRTLLVEVGRVKAFSDVAGRHVVRLSNSADSRNDIAERLRTAGCDISTRGRDWIEQGNFNIQRKTDKVSLGYEPEDLSEGDIIALLEGWWPKSKEMFPDDVSVQYRSVDQSLGLPAGSTKKYILIVAKRNSFKELSSGNEFARFTYDVNSDHFGTMEDSDRWRS